MDAPRRLLFFAALIAALAVESAAFVRPAAGLAPAPSQNSPADPSASDAGWFGAGHEAQPALGTLASTPVVVVATANEGPTGRAARALKRVVHSTAGPLARTHTPARALRALHRRVPLAWAPADRVDRTGRPFHGALAPPAPIRHRA